jgi:hypothetical protein
MSITNKWNPENLQVEKQKFLADSTYNPQFEYAIPFEAAELRQWGEPTPELINFARQVLEQKGFSEQQIQFQEFSVEVVSQRCRSLLEQIGVTEEFFIRFDAQKVLRCGLRGNIITFKTPILYLNEAELEGTLNHELQTHFLRNINQKKQGWTKNPALESQLRSTEEGLAVLHSLLPQPKSFARRAFQHYVTISLANEKSFAQVFQQLRDLGSTEAEAWEQTYRVKRGLRDTSQPGGNTKDISYLKGMITMWKWLTDPNHHPKDLYLGKISTEEIEEKKRAAVTQTVYYPTFFNNLETYRQTIYQIGIEHHFNELKL